MGHAPRGRRSLVRRTGRGLAVSHPNRPGNPQGRSPKESGRKSVTVVDTQDATVRTVREVDVALFTY